MDSWESISFNRYVQESSTQRVACSAEVQAAHAYLSRRYVQYVQIIFTSQQRTAIFLDSPVWLHGYRPSARPLHNMFYNNIYIVFTVSKLFFCNVLVLWINDTNLHLPLPFPPCSYLYFSLQNGTIQCLRPSKRALDAREMRRLKTKTILNQSDINKGICNAFPARF